MKQKRKLHAAQWNQKKFKNFETINYCYLSKKLLGKLRNCYIIHVNWCKINLIFFNEHHSQFLSFSLNMINDSENNFYIDL